MGFLDSIEGFLRGLTGTERAGDRPDFGVDPDLAEAIEELERYIRDEEPDSATGAGTTGPGRTGRTGSRSGRRTGPGHTEAGHGAPPESLRTHYRNLEVPFGAPFTEVSARYRALVRRYHPDRYAASGQEKLTVANEIIKRLNNSYRIIKEYHQHSGRR